MVKSLKDSDLPEPWFGNKSKAPPAPKRQRVTSEVMPEQEASEAEATGTCMKKGKGRGRPKKKDNPTAKGKNSVKYDRTGPATVVLGRTKNPVADPQELRRKRAEDAAACGRVVKTIPRPGNRRSCTTISDTDTSDDKSEDGLAPTEKGLGSVNPPAVKAIALSGGVMAESPAVLCNAVGNAPNLSSCRT